MSDMQKNKFLLYEFIYDKICREVERGVTLETVTYIYNEFYALDIELIVLKRTISSRLSENSGFTST